MDEDKKLYLVAARFLSYRPRSEKEIRDKLIRKNAPLEVINKVIAKLTEQKFLNDLEFAKMWMESRIRVRGKSLRIIKLELKQKGISNDIIDSLIHNSELLIQDENTAQRLVEKKIEKYRHLTKQEIYQKLGGFLARRGFDWDTIKHSIDEELGKRV